MRVIRNTPYNIHSLFYYVSQLMIFPTEYEVRSTEIAFLPYHMRFSRVDIYTSRNGRLFFSQSTDRDKIILREKRGSIAIVNTCG